MLDSSDIVYESQAKLMEKLIREENRSDARSYNSKVRAIYNMWHYVESLDCFDKAIKLKPDCARALNNKGNCLYLLGRLEESKNALEKAVSMHPHYAISNHNRKIILRSKAGKKQNKEQL